MDEFAAVVAREDVTHGKPAPDLFAEAARRLDVAPDRCLAVDDAPDGVTSARAAGMRVIAMIDGHLAPTDNGAEPAARFAANTGTPRYGHDPRTRPNDGARPSHQGA